ncbi:MAG: hypothetical protein AABX80_03120 [Nanoarchaeota archaeon]
MENKNTSVWIESPEMKEFFVDVTKTFMKHKGEGEIVTLHGPETHHGSHHSQLNLIDREGHHAFKIKFKE